MITLECASRKGLLECASMSVPEGKICVVLTETDIERSLILRVISGQVRLDSGKISIFGEDMASMPYPGLNDLRKRMGIVMSNGGLVSNLKVWENIMLPLAYHKALSNHDIEDRMTNTLRKVGYDDEVTLLSGPLPAYKKRLVGLVRAMLMEPDLMIYDSLFEGLSAGMRGKVLDAVNEFHALKKGRTSVFLEPEEKYIGGIRADIFLTLDKGKLRERD